VMRDRSLTTAPARNQPRRRRAGWALAGAALVASLPVACVSEGERPTRDAPRPAEPAAPTGRGLARSFALGFTHFPHAVSTDALLDTYEVIGSDGDLVAQHFDGGVPWPEALAGARFAENFERELEGTARVQPEGHRVYLAVALWSVSDPATSCIQVLESFDLSIPLGALAMSSRAVTLNGEAVGAASAGG